MKKISGNPYIAIEEDKIKLDNCYLEEVLKSSKTPFMVILESRIRNNIKTFNKVFQSVFNNFQGFYSFKANFLPEVCSIINSENFGAEVISLPELDLALHTGFPANRILSGGPYLSPDFLEKSIKKEVREIVVYNMNDIERINDSAFKNNKIQNICLRLNSNKYGSRLGINFDANNIRLLKKILQKCENIRFTTLLSHFSTQMNDIKQFKKNLDAIVNTKSLLEKSGIKIEKINMGGGFPEAVIMPEAQLEIIAKKLKAYLNEVNLSFNELYFEPGRYIVGDAAIYVAKIINTQSDRWISVNIGTNICPKFARCSLRFYNASVINAPHKYKTSIAGIVPTDQDVLVKDYFFTKRINVDDLILITNVGAYSLTFSNRFPYALPSIFKIKGSEFTKIFDPIEDKDFSIRT